MTASAKVAAPRPADLIAAGVCAPKAGSDARHGEWPERRRFAAFVATLGLRHFGADELLFLGEQQARGRCAGLNAYPPEELWPNVAAPILALDALATETGREVYVLSAYRSPAYNACITGSDPDSPHTRFAAIDFFCDAGSPEDWAAILRRYRGAGRFSGGIGTYLLFVHVDADGRTADW